jgi:tRNA threonylcarbamoyladenosine biosynthesis protein TsaB
MTASEPVRLVLIETSGRAGHVALAHGERLLAARRLDESRRHARDLAPALRGLLDEQGWKPRDLHGVVVSRGPGSYTGLRVGIMSAKALAYATGCALLAVETFAVIAEQAPAQAASLDVVADAQQDRVYVQRFARGEPGAGPVPVTPLTIQPVAGWLASLPAGGWVSGPGLRKCRERLPAGVSVVEGGLWDPAPETLLCVGLRRYCRGERDDLWAVEPLYLRPSSAEEQWEAKNPAGAARR